MILGHSSICSGQAEPKTQQGENEGLTGTKAGSYTWQGLCNCHVSGATYVHKLGTQRHVVKCDRGRAPNIEAALGLLASRSGQKLTVYFKND